MARMNQQIAKGRAETESYMYTTRVHRIGAIGCWNGSVISKEEEEIQSRFLVRSIDRWIDKIYRSIDHK